MAKLFTKKTGFALLTVVCAGLLAVLGMQVLSRYDNKYTKKAALSQEGSAILPQSGLAFLVDGWKLYPDRLLEPKDFAAGEPSPQYSTWVGEWPSLAPFHEDGSPFGTATYRILLEGEGMTALYLPEPLCAARIFVDGKELGGPGQVSKYRPLLRDTTVSFPVEGQAEVIIQTANYSHYYSGLWYPPGVGSPEAVTQMAASRILFYGFLCFPALALAIFCLGLWLGRKVERDRASFWFGLLCLSFAMEVSHPFFRLWGAPQVQLLTALEDGFSLLELACGVRLGVLFFLPPQWKRVSAWSEILTLGMCCGALVVPLAVLPAFPGFAPFYGQLISWYKVLAAVFLLGAAAWGCIMGQSGIKSGARPVLGAVTANGVCLFWGVIGIGGFEPIVGGWPEEYGALAMALAFAWLMMARGREMAAENLALNRSLQEKVEEKTQHLQQLLAERGQLMAELGHDMKSPLTALSNMAQIIGRNGILLDPGSQERLEGIETQCQVLADRVRAFQELSGEISPALLTPLILNKFLGEFHRTVQPVVELTGPDLLLKLSPLPCPVLGNREKLSRALENLVFNAAAFTPPEGQILLSLEQEGRFARISCADTGEGIAEEILPRVFHRFYSTRSEEGGQGLGLAITQAIVLEHGGTITVASQVGKGTIFTILLPLAEA